MANPILEAAQSMLSTQTANIATEREQQVLDTAKVTKQNDIITDTIKEIGSANATIDLVQQTAKLATQNTTQEIFAASGGTEEQLRLTKELKKDGQAREALLAKQAERDSSMGVFKHWLNAELGGALTAGLDNQVRTAQSEYQNTLNMIQGANAAQDANHQANVRAQTNANEATILANQTKIMQQTEQDIAKSRLNAVQSNAVARTRTLALDDKAANNLLTVYKLQGDVETRAGQAEARAFARLSHEQSIKEWAVRLPALQVQLESSQLALETARATTPSKIPAMVAQNKKLLDQIVNEQRAEEQSVIQVQDAFATVGMTPPTEEIIKEGFRDPKSNQYYTAVARVGAEQSMGDTPAEAKATRALVDPTGSAPETKYSKLHDEVAQRMVRDTVAAGGKLPKEGTELYAQSYNMAAETLLAEYASEIKSGDSTNPYAAPPFAVLEMSHSVQKSPLYKKVLSKQGYTNTEPDLIMANTDAAVRAGVVTPEEAARGLVTLFTAAVNDNNTSQGGFLREGFDDSVQTSYNISVLRPLTMTERLLTKPTTINIVTSALGFSSGGTPVATGELPKKYTGIDMTDYTSVRNHLVNLASSAPLKSEDKETK